MKYVRLYAGQDGETHFADVEIEAGSIPGRSGLGRSWPVSEAIFLASREDSRALDTWHNAPAVQFVVLLTGEAEYEASDGEVRRLGPGDVMLVEDTAGKGHKARHFGDRTAIHIPLRRD
jgi:hypothetical protein